MGWSVYKHTLPNGKVYIGITSLPPEQRWNNGLGYQSQYKFFKEIVAYGWNNIGHEIVGTELNETDAREIERTMIAAEEGNSLNVQWHTGVSLDWLRTHIAEEDSVTRKKRFREFSDHWLEKVKYQDTVPFDWEINETYMDLTYYTCKGKVLYADGFRVILPPHITYNELYSYLTYKCDFTKADHIRCDKLGEVG